MVELSQLKITATW